MRHGFDVGDRVRINECGPLVGEVGVVVDYVEENERAQKDPGVRQLVGDRLHLVPVFVAKYPGTYFWWIAPQNLKKATK